MHLRIGVDRLAVHIAALHQMRAVARNAGPFEVLNRVEGIELRRPHFINRSTTRVVHAISKSQILPDGCDRIAAEISRDLIAEVRDGCASRQSTHVAREWAEECIEVRCGDGANGSWIARGNHWIRLRIKHERGVRNIRWTQTIVKTL